MNLLRRLVLITASLVLNTSGGVLAQSADPIVTNGNSLPADFEGVEIDSIVIENRNIYDTDEEGYDKFLFRLANKLHIKTRAYVVRRELLQREGDLFSSSLAEEAARNLRRSLKVYDAWIETEMLPSGKLLMRVVTIDEWSFTGGLSYSREGNETRYQIGAEEENFLGNNQFISFYYYAQSDDDDFVEGRFFENRLFGKPYQLSLKYSDNPVGEIESIAVKRPYYDLEQKYSYGLVVQKFGGRRDVYDDSLKIGQSAFDGDIIESDVSYRFGQYDRKTEIELDYVYRFERNTDQEVFYDSPEDSALAFSSFAGDSLYHQISVGGNYSDFEYIREKQIDGFGYTEDILLGFFSGVRFGRAFHADFKGHDFDRVDAFLSEYFKNGSSIVLLDYSHTWWLDSGDPIRHYTLFSGKYYNRLSSWVTLAVRGRYVSDWDADGDNRLILGGTTGIRGYDKFFRTGQKRLVFNAEARFFSNIKFLSALFGAAVFTDWGNTWKSSEPVKVRDFYSSVGGGLRIAFEKSTKNIVRIDLAFSNTNQWELSIGTDQYFFVRQ